MVGQRVPGHCLLHGDKKSAVQVDIARTTSHSATSVGRYLRDYERVRELATRNIPLTQISRLLGLQPSVVAAYHDLIRQYHPHLLPVPDG